jgi:hypothetical protein
VFFNKLHSLNYFGYLLGAILCMLQPIVWKRYQLRPLSSARMVRSALIAIACLTALMANDSSVSWTYLRFITGSVTAIGFVYTSSWCLAHLAQRNASTTGGIVYAGPGVGIAVSGLFASVMVAYDFHAAQGWCAFGLLAAIVTAIVWRVFHDDESSPEITHQQTHIGSAGGRETAGLHNIYYISVIYIYIYTYHAVGRQGQRSLLTGSLLMRTCLW